jgi:glyceraldehyde 3-phosphate dehydrogenase
MAVKVAINGFGRIGRLVFRAAFEHKTADIEVVLVNDLTTPETLAHLLKYDSVHGRFPGKVEVKDGNLVVDGKSVKVTAEKDPAALPHKDLGVVIVVESTGRFTDKASASKHIEAGAKKVIISAPSKDADKMIVLGVNDSALKPEDKVVSNASCTTNCLAPVVKVLNDNFKIKRGLMTTIHAYTNDQNVQDFPHKDLRRARAAALSMIPTKTGAAAAIGKVIPELNGKLDGFAIRVPTPNVSVVDLTCEVEKSATAESLNAAMKKAAEGELKGILGYETDPTVSVDYNHCDLSSVFDSANTRVIDGNFVKVLSWYDNEWGYSVRCVELIEKMAKM